MNKAAINTHFFHLVKQIYCENSWKYDDYKSVMQ